MTDPTQPKNLITCCGYTAAQGQPAPWECPGCHTVHTPEVAETGPAPYVPVPPGGQGGLPSLPLPLPRM